MNKQEPILVESPFTKRVFVLTSYSVEGDGVIIAHEKHDVTEQFEALKEQRSQSWIPVTERLPETTDHVLVSCKTKKGVKIVNRSYYNGKHWAGVMSGVEAWMPLPAPYGGDAE